MEQKLLIKIINKNISEVNGSVIALKYTQDNYGLSQYVIKINDEVRKKMLASNIYEAYLQHIEGLLITKGLFVHLPLNSSLDYKDISSFIPITFDHLYKSKENVDSLITILQGADFLDEEYSLHSLISGLFETIKQNRIPKSLKEFVIVERDIPRYERLITYLKKIINSCKSFTRQISFNKYEIYNVPDDYELPKRKEKHLFVAMPFSDDFEDIYYLGIEPAIKSNGYLVHRIDKTRFIGDIVKEMLEKIETAQAVIADLTGSNPNVYLELGFCWGKEKKNILIAKNLEELRFDVRNRRCLKYTNIRGLKEELTKEIKELIKDGNEYNI